jgi:hypothetical protein
MKYYLQFKIQLLSRSRFGLVVSPAESLGLERTGAMARHLDVVPPLGALPLETESSFFSLRSSGARRCPRLIFWSAMYDVGRESKTTPDQVPQSSTLMVHCQGKFNGVVDLPR